MTFLLTVLRGLRSRALLSAGSVLLTALAIGSAVLGPVFSAAVTDSFLVSRLNDAPNPSTGLSWTFGPLDGADTDQAQQHAADAATQVLDDADGRLFATPQTTLATARVDTRDGQVLLAARSGACDHLEVTGRCPTRPGEVALLAYDLDFTGTTIGQTVDLGSLGVVTVVGSYRAPAEADADFWFDTSRLTSSPPRTLPGNGGSTPYRPAPWITPPATFATLPSDSWHVLVDRRLDVPADLTQADLEDAVRATAILKQPA